MEVRECSPSPEIVGLKAQCELAPYCGAAANRQQFPFGLAGPVFEVVPRHLCKRRDYLSVLEVQILFAQCHGYRKKIYIFIFFTLHLLWRAFFGRGELSCAIPHSAVWSLDRS